MRAVILAAGFGSRLQDVLKGKPKPLFELNGKSLLEYSLESLVKSGIEQIDLAIGYRGETIREYINNKFPNAGINYHKNNQYNETGSMHSFFLSLKKPQDCLILDGDVIYEHQLIPDLINYNKKNAVVLSRWLGSGEDVFVALNKNNEVIHLGKRLSKKESPFESVGIFKLSEQFIEKMFELHRENLNKNKLEEYYENCAYRVSKEIPLYGFVKLDLNWCEIDKKEDIPNAKKALANFQK